MTHAEFFYNQLIIKLTYLYNMLVFDFSYLKFIIFGAISFILFECIIGWYMPERTKQYKLKSSNQNTQTKQPIKHNRNETDNE